MLFRFILLALVFFFSPILTSCQSTSESSGTLSSSQFLSLFSGDESHYYRIDAAPWQQKEGFAIYGSVTSEYLAMTLHSDTAIGPATTLWLNTDQDRTSGYLIWGWAGGAEYNVEFLPDGSAALYTGGAGETLVSQDVELSFNEDKTIVDLQIPLSAFVEDLALVDVILDINNSQFFPSDYGLPAYTVSNQEIQPFETTEKRLGIVFSQTTADHFFYDKAYSQLFMSLQHQAMMAGIPFDLLNEEDLKDVNRLTKYQALVLPYFSHVNPADVSLMKDSLYKAIYQLGIGVISSGDLFANDHLGQAMPGDSYEHMKKVLGIKLAGGSLRDNPDLLLTVAGGGLIPDLPLTEPLFSQNQVYVNEYQAVEGQAYKVLAEDVDLLKRTTAVLQGSEDYKVVHFNSPESLSYSNLAFRAIHWALYGDKPAIGHKLTRHNYLFLARNDMDQSQYHDSFHEVYDPLLELLADWKKDYNFVGSYYINVGNNPDNGEFTDWADASLTYQEFLDGHNEIGTHSYTHPHHVNELTDAEIKFEFKQSKREISKELGIKVKSAAIPGNPETLDMSLKVGRYVKQLSGEYSGPGSGYQSAFGFLKPDAGFMYLSPNMTFDFTLIEFWQWTAEEALDYWEEELSRNLKNASQPVVHWPWHDYGPTVSLPDGYTIEMFEQLIKMAYDKGAEFVTGLDFLNRVKRLNQSQLAVEHISDHQIKVTITGPDGKNPKTGSHALKLYGGQKIQSVEGWPAFDRDTVFLPNKGGEFIINTGEGESSQTRISSLPMRAYLKHVVHKKNRFNFNFTGQGEVKIQLGAYSGVQKISGVSDYQIEDGVLFLNFDSYGKHKVKLTLQ